MTLSLSHGTSTRHIASANELRLYIKHNKKLTCALARPGRILRLSSAYLSVSEYSLSLLFVPLTPNLRSLSPSLSLFLHV